MRRPASLLTLAIALAISSRAIADEADACITAAEESQPLRRSGKLRAARTKLLTCSRAACPGVVASDCGKWLAEVESMLATVMLRVTDGSGQDVTDARALVDGEVIEIDPEGVFFLEPGKHVLEVEREGAPPAKLTLIARPGDRRKPVDVILRRSALPPTTTPTSVARARDDRTPTLAIVLGAAGVAAIGAGAVLWIVGRSDYADLRAGCGQTASCASGDVRAMKTKLQIGDVLFGAGAIAFGAGLYIGLSTTGTSTTSLGIRPGARGATLVLESAVH